MRNLEPMLNGWYIETPVRKNELRQQGQAENNRDLAPKRLQAVAAQDQKCQGIGHGRKKRREHDYGSGQFGVSLELVRHNVIGRCRRRACDQDTDPQVYPLDSHADQQ